MNSKEINFHKKIYSQEAIKMAAAAYKEISSVKIKNNSAYFQVTLKDFPRMLADTITDEFSNYVLAETKKCL